MADKIKIQPDQLDKAFDKLLDKYKDEVFEIVEDAAKDAARKATSELKQVSPGKFAKKWRHKAYKPNKRTYGEIIYNDNYRLTHLLEKEHGVNGDGKYPKHPGSKTDHTGKIAEVDEKYTEKFYNDIVNKL